MTQTSRQMNLALIGAPYKNLARASFANWWAASEMSSEFAVELLGNGLPSETWRSSNPYGGNTIVGLNTIEILGGSLYSGSWYPYGVAGSNHNLTPQYGQYRVFCNDVVVGDDVDDPFAGYVVDVLPASLLGTSNTSGAVTDIDEATTPDGVAPNTGMIYPTSFASAYSGRIRFATPSYPGGSIETTNTDKRQEFWFFVRTGTATTNSNFSYVDCPRIAVSLYSNGVLVRALGEKKITKGASGQWVCFTFNGSEVSDLTKCEAFYNCHGSSAGDNNVKIDTARWRSEGANWTSIPSYDTGWQTFSSSIHSDDYTRRYGRQQSLSYIGTGTAAIVQPAIYIAFRDDQAVTDWSPSTLEWRDPQGYVELGSMDVSRVWQAEISFQKGDILSGKNLTTVKETQGGQRYGTSLNTRRALRVPHDFLTTPEGALLKDRLDRLGPLRTFFVHAYPKDSGVENDMLSFPCTCPDPISYEIHLNNPDHPRAAGLVLEEAF